MMIRWIGAASVLAGCGTLGFMIAAGYRRESAVMREFIALLESAECELQYRAEKLPDLFRYLSESRKNVLSAFCLTLSSELDSQVHPDVPNCVNAALRKCPRIPEKTGRLIQTMGQSLGQFDMKGQLQELRAVRNEAETEYIRLIAEQKEKIKNIKTMGICAGAAIVILFI